MQDINSPCTRKSLVQENYITTIFLFQTVFSI